SPLIAGLPEADQALAEGERGGLALRSPGAGTPLGGQLAGPPEPEQRQPLTELVRAEAASILGHPSPEAVAPGRALKALGVDSVTAVELRDRLNAATGLTLPATLVFDHPTPVAAAEFLRAQLLGVAAGASDIPVAAAAAGEP